MIKAVTRLERTNPSVAIDRMDDYQAMHHEISDAQCISFVWPRKWSILREEGSGSVWSYKDAQKARAHKSFSENQ